MPTDVLARRLAAIVAADVVGYSRLVRADEEGTLAALKAFRRNVFDPLVARHRGRIVKLMGDGVLVEFASVLDAVRAAIETQRALPEHQKDVAEDRRILLRIGINLGDVVVDGDDIYGDGVNVAARLEPLAAPGGICISGTVYEEVRDRLSEAFDDGGEQTVKNIDRPIRIWQWRGGGSPATAKAATPIRFPQPAGKPSIAILPFNNLSGDPEQEFFADGLVEDITTTLSKLSGLSVIARNSSFVYKGRAVDVRQVAQELGVRYVLEGSVRKGGNRIRITAQLIEAESGTHVWAERYDRDLADIFAVQDEITLVLATEMQVKLTEGEQARMHYTTTSNVAAWTHWAQGMVHFRQPITKDQFGQARFCFEKALALEPESAALNAMLGFMHYIDARFGWWDEQETAMRKGHAAANRALELDPDSPDAHSTSSMLLMFEGSFDEAVVRARKAVRMAPGAADTAAWACYVLASSGYPEEAIVQIEKAMSLSPNYPPNYLGHLGNCYRLSGRTAEAIAAFKAYGERSPGFGLADLVIAYCENGQPDEARHTAAALMAARPGFTVESWAKSQSRKDRSRLEADLAALRSSGLPG